MTEPHDSPVVVVGGTGFLGRRVVRALAARGRAAATGTRAPERAGDAPRPLRTDLADRAGLERAFAGAGAVVNCVGLYVERGADTFRAVHVEGARRVAEAARTAGVARLVQLSGIGADPASPDPYIRARGEGETAVRAAFPGAVILRPSAMFSENAGLFAALAPIVAALPVVPLFGRGATRLQPVHADDVAEVVARVLDSDIAPGQVLPGQVFELGGPEILSYREILARLAARAGRRRLFLPLPFAFWRLAAAAASLLPRPPLTPAQVALLRRDNVADPGLPGFAALGIAPRPPGASGLV